MADGLPSGYGFHRHNNLARQPSENRRTIAWTPRADGTRVSFFVVPWTSLGICVIRDSGGVVEESPKPQAPSARLGSTIVRRALCLAKETGVLLDFAGLSVLTVARSPL